MKSPVSPSQNGGQSSCGGRRYAVALLAFVALLLVPAGASAASPVLEFVTPGHTLPVNFTTESGPLTAQMAGFEILVKCTASQGEGKITGLRSTISKYRLTGCTAGGSQKCKSEGANSEEIVTEPIEADLVYIDQAKQQVGMLLNPGGGTYMSFECGGESAVGRGSFLAPVSPLNQETTSFTATLDQSEDVQVPSDYENEKGELLQAIPTGQKGTNKFVPTGVQATFTVHPSVPVEVRAITAQEGEAAQRESEAKQLQATLKKQEEALQGQEAALKKFEEALKRGEEHAKQLEAAKKHEEEASAQAAAAAKKYQQELAAARKQLLTRALRDCHKQPRSRRARCEAGAHKKYGASAASRAT